MGANFLTTTSSVMCPHGGSATLVTSNSEVTIEQSPILLETDIHVVAGCAFTVGSVYMPCLRIQWSAGSERVSIDGIPALTMTSVGTCYNAQGAPQGTAIIANTQPEVSGE